MSRLLARPVSIGEILSGLHCEDPLDGSAVIEGVCALEEDLPGHLTFSTSPDFELSRSTVVAPVREPHPRVIFAENPRVLFTRILHHLNSTVGFEPRPPGVIAADALIEEGAFVSPGASVGNGSVIERGAVIREGVHIGSDCHIHSGVVIGDAGFGYSRSEDGTLSHFLHLGGVRIADRVVIGTNSTVAAGSLLPTVIESDVKTDNLVHIGHNCHIMSGVLIAACAEISGSVVIGKNAWLGPNCSIIDNCAIGEEAFIGLGAVVIRSVDAGSVVAGNPAKVLRRTH